MARRLIYVTNNAFDSILLVARDHVIGAWNADDVTWQGRTTAQVFAAERDAPEEWDETYPTANTIEEWGTELTGAALMARLREKGAL